MIDQENELIRALFHIRNLIFEEAKKTFIAQGLTPVEVMTLFRIKHGPAEHKVTELAQEMGVPPSTMTGIMDRLVEKGFILRERSEGDRRVVTVKIRYEKMKDMETHNQISAHIRNVLLETDPEWIEDLKDKLVYLERKLEERIENRKGIRKYE